MTEQDEATNNPAGGTEEEEQHSDQPADETETAPQEAEPAAAANPAEPDAAEPAAADTTTEPVYDWSAFYDAEGNLYYYNSVTEESSWDAPEQGFNPPEEEAPAGTAAEEEAAAEGEAAPTEGETAATTAWVAFQDDEGQTYYYNESTGETQWEQPDDYVAAEAAAEEQQEAVVEAKEEGEPAEPAAMEVEEVVKEEEEEPEPEQEEEIDPVLKRLQAAEAALQQPDSVLEPGCIANVTEVVTSQDGNPQSAILALIDNYHGQTAICGLLGRWMADLKGHSAAAATAASSSGQEAASAAAALEDIKDEIRNVAQDVIHRVATERFTKEAGDGILNLSKTEAAFLQDMMDSPQWRKLLIDLSAVPQNKDSAVLMYCLRAISKRGHHREIARRVNQSEHFAVFNAMLSSELAVIGKGAVSAGGDATASMIGLDEIVADLRRSASTTSYTYLYSQELLRYLDAAARGDGDDNETNGGNQQQVTPRIRRALHKWESLRESLQDAMMDPSTSSSVAGSSPLFRKRRLDVALTVSDLHQHQRRRHNESGAGINVENDDDNGGSLQRMAALETALLNFLRRYSAGIQLDDAVLDPLLPTGLDLTTSGDVGSLLIQHPLAVKALLGYLYKPGFTRVTAPVVRNKCARLVAFAVMAAEKDAAAEADSSSPQEDSKEEQDAGSDEVALTRMILQGSQLCEQLEIMVSFLVSTKADTVTSATSPGQKLCSLAFKCAAVAQGTIIWAKGLTSGNEFAASPSFPTLSTSIMSLVRLVCEKQPFTRRDGVEIAMCFLHHFNSDISYQKLNAIKERSLRLLLHLLVHGEVMSVLGKITSKLQDQKGSSVLDASLIRYFVGGILQAVQPPVSIVFLRAFGALLKAPKCLDAVRTSYFGDTNRKRLVSLLESFQSVRYSGGGELEAEDAALVASLFSSYQIKVS